MITTNYHTHNSLCDGKGEIEEYIEAAVNKEFSAIGFSSHAPLPYANEWTLNSEKLEEYLARIRTAKAACSDRIEVYTGLEVDFLPGVLHPRDKHITDLQLDYVIGSVHSLPAAPGRNTWLAVDGPDEEFLTLLNDVHKGSIASLGAEYYHQIREMLRIGGFNILGHIDLIKKKNMKYAYLDESEPWYRNQIDRTLAVLKGSGVILEINTGGMARGATHEPYPSPWILTLAAQAGIPIQLNADAHEPGNIDFAYPQARAMAAECGVTEFTVLLKGKWQKIKVT